MMIHQTFKVNARDIISKHFRHVYAYFKIRSSSPFKRCASKVYKFVYTFKNSKLLPT